MTTTQPAGQSRKRTSLRTDILEDRPVNLDGFVEESGPRRASSRWRARSTRSRACVSRTA
jgi:hypothetical protein